MHYEIPRLHSGLQCHFITPQSFIQQKCITKYINIHDFYCDSACVRNNCGIYNYLYDYNIAAPMMRAAIIVMKKQRNSAPDPAFEKGSVMKTSSTVGLVIL